jgi:short-subunit dehydrogenase
MKKSSAILYTAQLLTGIAVSAASYALRRRPAKHKHKGQQVVLITGGSHGLGLALAERYGRAGAKLVLAARDHDALTAARHTLLGSRSIHSPDDVLLIPADLTVPDQAATLIEHAIAHFGHIDVLINNAGIIEVGPVENQPLAAYHRAMATNFFAAVHTTLAVLPHMLSRKSGSIVNIASIGGKFAMPHLLPYVSSKFALVGFSQGLHAELRHKGIRVTTVCPGLMRTGGEANAHYTGQAKKEERWFTLAATTPVIAASVSHAAEKIFQAASAGRAEITITPQAWLAARAVALAPETAQYLASLANYFLLPAPSTNDQLTLTVPASHPKTDLTASSYPS